MKRLRIGVAMLGLAWAALAMSETTYPLQVHLPEPGYKKWDGSLLNFTEFKKTTVIYGTCDATTQIGTEMGRVDVKSWGFVSPTFRVPVNTKVCIVAVVIGLDDVPMGRSNVATFDTRVENGKVPKEPQLLRIS